MSSLYTLYTASSNAENVSLIFISARADASSMKSKWLSLANNYPYSFITSLSSGFLNIISLLLANKAITICSSAFSLKFSSQYPKLKKESSFDIS